MNIVSRLKKADQFVYEKFKTKVLNSEVKPNWIDKEDIFWYSTPTVKGKKFFLVDINKKNKEILFDHSKMVVGLKKIGINCTQTNIPISDISMKSNTNWILLIGYEKFSFNTENYEIERIGKTNPKEKMGKSFSPDGNYYVYIEDNNLYLKDMLKEQITQLTCDGKENYSYGKFAGTIQRVATMKRDGLKFPPAVIWSPDGKTIVSHKTDERQCVEMPMLQSAVKYGDYPKIYKYRTTFPGGVAPKAEFVAFDVETKKEIDIDMKPMDIGYGGTPFIPVLRYVKFNGKDNLYFLYVGRGYKSLVLYRYNLTEKKAIKIYEEESEKFIEPSSSIAEGVDINVTKDNNKALIYSTRDGWGHLYLYDAKKGGLINQITKGNYNVTEIIKIDEIDEIIFFEACGKEGGINPYYRYYYKIKFDGTKLKLLTPENANHSTKDIDLNIFEITYKFSPTGKYFIDTYSRIDVPPITVVRDLEGNIVMELETSDITKLKDIGWSKPEFFKVKARDKKTDLYGIIYKPSHFDPNKKYPVIDCIYPGPHRIKTPKSFTDVTIREAYVLAELGFIVINVDGLGTPFRSKKFHDFSYNNLHDATLPDHITAIKQLAQKRPYMDIEKVGITGISAGAYATCIAMFKHSDFYKVGVSSNAYLAGDYYLYEWMEKYMEYPYNKEKYGETCLLNMVEGLKGKLLLLTGDFDENINAPTQIMLANELIKAKKDFDIFVAPNSGHLFEGNREIQIRKKCDYFLKHLKGEEIPFDVEFPSTI